MKYCKECGAKLEGDEKFCPECGMKIEEDTPRQTNCEGEIQKCPNCGEVLNSFTPVCPSCGFELRNAKSSSGVTEFVGKIQDMELKRKKIVSKGIFGGLNQQEDTTDEQKISLIRNYPIPNTKEDLYEFLILSKSNIEVKLYAELDANSKRLALSDAWKVKFEQAYQKAKWLFKDDERMMEIQEMYDEFDKSMKIGKLKRIMVYGWWIIIPVLCGIINWITSLITYLFG